MAATVAVVALTAVAVSIEAVPARAATQGDQIAAAAASQAGVAYCDGGGGINGPTHGAGDPIGCTGNTPGYDCMSLVQYSVYQVTGIALPNDGSQLPGVGTVIPAADTAALLPGDAVFWGGSGLDGFVHSGIYAGNNEVWDAISMGNPVQLHSMAYLRSQYTYDGAIRFWTPPAPSLGGLPGPVVGMAATPDGTGYWLANAAGGVSEHGSATSYGSLAGRPLNAPITHIVGTPDGKGYWLVASDGGTFAFGDAGYYGSMGGRHLNAPVVDIAPTADGRGYWLVASDGGIFAFGDAAFRGSMGGVPLAKPVVGITPDGTTGGYWEVATDGGIFAFGAPYLGSTGSLALNRPVNGMAPTATDRGYLLVASDGGTFAFGDAAFHGSTGGLPLNAPIVGLAADSASGGYWLVAADGGIFAFGAPFYGAD